MLNVWRWGESSIGDWDYSGFFASSPKESFRQNDKEGIVLTSESIEVGGEIKKGAYAPF